MLNISCISWAAQILLNYDAANDPGPFLSPILKQKLYHTLQVFEDMKQCPVTITREGCKAVLKACWNAGEIQLYSALMEEFVSLGVYQDKQPTNRRQKNLCRNGNEQYLSFNSSSFGSGFMIGSGSSRGPSSEWLSGAETPSPTAMTYWEYEAIRYV